MSSLTGNIYFSRNTKLMEAGMWETDCGENWVLFWWAGPCSVIFNPIFCWLGATVFPACCLTWDQTMEIKPVNPKGNQSWIFNGRTGAEAPILWPPVAKNWLIGKYPDAGKDWRQEKKGTTRMRWFYGITDLTDMSLSNLLVLVMDGEDWHAAVHGVEKGRTRLIDWTELKRNG